MILIIDDDKAVQTSLSLLLRQQGYKVAVADGPQSALDQLDRHSPQLILLDLNFSIETTGEEGLALFSQIQSKEPGIPVILITGWATIDLAVQGMKMGAKDFISKPWNNDHLLQSISTILALEKTQTPASNRKKLDEKYDFENLIGEDPSFLNILESVGRVAATDASVLILGESGTGKELIAEAIHQNSKRGQKPFVKVNLGGIPENLFESELFGHKRGAFTDARYDRKGRFELAHTGTIFLDEIGDLEWPNQVKLLRVLQDHTFEVLGSSQTKKVNVRVISATNRDLSKMVSEGQFREDLFYRLNLITLRLPALRERPGDIPLLIQFYIDNLKHYYDKPNIELSSSAMNWLKNYPFPGNIRQLKNVVERTVLLSNSNRLEIEDFQPHLTDIPQAAQKGALPEVGSMTLEEMEIQMIKKAMAFHQNKVSRVARALGLTRSSLYRRLEKYGIPYE
jgi:two-component system NtrC family response regulator